MFNNFENFSKRFAKSLPYKKLKSNDYLLISLSNRAVSLTKYLSDELNLEYDILLHKPIFAPNNKECIIARISETKDVVIHSNLIDSFEIDEDFIFEKAKVIYDEELLPKIKNIRKGESLTSLKNRDVLIIDYGIEDGITALCAIKSLIKNSAKSISLAVGVIPSNLYEEFEKIIDSIYYIAKIEDFVDTNHYLRFDI